MSLSDLIGGIFGSSGSGVETGAFECQDCRSTFESAKDVDRLQCPECLSNDVERIDERG